MALPTTKSLNTISAEDTFSDPVEVAAGQAALLLSGTFSATVTVQVSPDGGTTWYSAQDTQTAPGVWALYIPCNGLRYKWGIVTGDYSSGDVTGSIAQ